MNMHRNCCCNTKIEKTGPAVFIMVGPDEESTSNPNWLADTMDLGECNPFCCMDEDVIHPKIDAAKYEISNEFVDEDGLVRVGLELHLLPDCGQMGCGGFGPNNEESPYPPQCYELPFERFDYTRSDSNDINAVIDYTYNKIIERFGNQRLENGEINPYPVQIWFAVDSSGSHTMGDAAPIIDGLYDRFTSEWGADIADYKFNPCVDGPSCVAWGCCDEEQCIGAAPCYNNSGWGYSDVVNRCAYPMGREHFMSGIIDMIHLHFYEDYCDWEKVSSCGILSCRDCIGCENANWNIIYPCGGGEYGVDGEGCFDRVPIEGACCIRHDGEMHCNHTSHNLCMQWGQDEDVEEFWWSGYGTICSDDGICE
jgi:hypothetical protein